MRTIVPFLIGAAVMLVVVGSRVPGPDSVGAGVTQPPQTGVVRYDAGRLFTFEARRDLHPFVEHGEEGSLQGFEGFHFKLQYALERDADGAFGIGSPPPRPDVTSLPAIPSFIDGLPALQTEYRYRSAEGEDGVLMYWVIRGLEARGYPARRLVIAVTVRGAARASEIERIRGSIRVLSARP